MTQAQAKGNEYIKLNVSRLWKHVQKTKVDWWIAATLVESDLTFRLYSTNNSFTFLLITNLQFVDMMYILRIFGVRKMCKLMVKIQEGKRKSNSEKKRKGRLEMAKGERISHIYLGNR